MLKTDTTNWRVFSWLAALEAGAAFVALLLVPHGSGGISPSRLALLAVLAAGLLGFAYFALRPPRSHRFLSGSWSAPLAGGVSILIALAMFLLRYLEPDRLLPYYQRLSPLLGYLLLVAVEFTFCSLISRYGWRTTMMAQRKPLWRASLIALAISWVVFLFVAITRIGLASDSAYWGEPGVPVLGWQFALALLAGLAVLLVSLRSSASPRLDRVLPAVIWLLAVAIWLAVPVSTMRNSFYEPITPPTNQPFPNSDAAYYDSMAQSLLIGYPYQGDIPTRPLYVVFLAFLHSLVGERYDLIIAGQTLLLALIPVVFYFIGERLHSRAAGVIVALLAIFRELTSLWISSQTRVSNTKTLLVDLPTLLLVAAACLLAMRWFEHRDRNSALAAGGMFGLLLLLRTQSLLILPVLLLLAVLVYGLRNRSWALALAFFLGGMLLAVAPWLIHNYMLTGQLTFDAPFQYKIIVSQYSYTGNLDIGNVDLQGKSVFGILLTFILRDPGFVLGFISTHFFATLIDGLLALPLIEPYNGLLAPVNLYWMTWPANVGWLNVLVLIVYLAVIAIGLGASWKKLGWAGLTPLAFGLGYALTNGIARFSGWRYDLPADWVPYAYFAVGAAELLTLGATLFGADEARIVSAAPEIPAAEPEWRTGTAAVLGIVFFIVGALPWVAEGWMDPAYPEMAPTVLEQRLSASSSVQQLGIVPAQLQAFMSDPAATIEIGRVLYPRFFSRGGGLASAHPWPAYAPRDYPRLGFVLLNDLRHDVVLPIRGAPGGVVHGADAIVLGCRRADYIEVRLIWMPDAGPAYLTTPLDQPCN